MVIMVSAGLFAKSFFRMLHEDMGMVPDHLGIAAYDAELPRGVLLS